MFGHYTYLLYTLFIALPLLVGLWIYFWQILKKELKLIGIVTGVLTIYTGILWIYALQIHVWTYSSAKILNIYIFGEVLEDLIWWVIILLLQISVIMIFTIKQDKHESFFKRN